MEPDEQEERDDLAAPVDVVDAAVTVEEPETAEAGERAMAPERRPRVWPAAVALYILAAVVPEMMSGSTPPLRFIQPFNLVFLPLLYGSSALLIREAVARRRLGWANVLLMGAAFGVFQEALVVQTWFSYAAPGSASYTATGFSVAQGVDWSAAIAYTCYHSVISVATPLLLIRHLFPRVAGLPWLGRRSAVFLAMWLIIPSAAMAINVAMRLFAEQGYYGPPQPQYLYAALAVVALLALGLLVRLPRPRRSARPAPTPWRVLRTSFGLTLLFFISILPLAATRMPAAITLAATVAIVAWALWRVWTWSARQGWGAAQEYALALGVVGYFAVVMAPVEEYLARLPLSQGITGVDLAIFAALALVGAPLAWHARRVARQAAAAREGTAP
jgi:hypothetical protein